MNSSRSLTRWNRSRALSSSIEKFGYTSRTSTGETLLKNLFEKYEVILRSKMKADKLEEYLYFKKKYNYELSKNVETALELAKKYRVELTKGKDQVALFSALHSKQQKDIQKYQIKVQKLEEYLKTLTKSNEYLQKLHDKMSYKQQYIDKMYITIKYTAKYMQMLYYKNKELEKGVNDNSNLKQRIKILYFNVRYVRLQNEECNKEVRRVELEKKTLEYALRKTKPDAYKQQERIRYLYRVNLDMQRRMEDFNRRYNYLLRNIYRLNKELSETKNKRDYFSNQWEKTKEQLSEMTLKCYHFEQQFSNKSLDFDNLTSEHDKMTKKAENLENKLKETIEFYANQTIENAELKKSNAALQYNYLHIRKTMEHIKMIAYIVNVELIKKEANIKKLNEEKNQIYYKMEELLKKFERFDEVFQENSARGGTEIRESVYNTIRVNARLELDITDLKYELDEKSLKFGEERDILQRDLQTRNLALPTDKTLYDAIFSDKNEEMRILENSNQQLLKIKQSLYESMEEANKRVATIQRYNDAFKIRMLDLFKLTKYHEYLKYREQRYHGMLLESRSEKDNLEEQMVVLRYKNQYMYDEMFKLEMDNKNKALTVKDLQNIIKELDVETLQAKKQLLEKRDLTMKDIIEKFSNAVDSINIFFRCCLCSKFIKEPITVYLCGHNYCSGCTKGYEDDCFECNNGLPIEKTFINKYFAGAAVRYQFFLMLFSEMKKVFS